MTVTKRTVKTRDDRPVICVTVMHLEMGQWEKRTI